MSTGMTSDVAKCPDCGTPLKSVCEIPGKPRTFICPVALEAQRRGLLGKPGKKHTAVHVWEEIIEEKGSS